MFVKDCIYLISILISLFSIISLVYTIKNNNKSICNCIMLIDFVYIIYLIRNYFLLEDLSLPIGLEVLLIYFIEFIAGLLYLISLIVNSIKKKKAKSDVVSNKIILVLLVLLLFPIVIPSIFVKANENLINKSDLILVYESNGNGGFGDSEYFAYAIGDNYCKQFDLGIDIGGYDLKKYLPKDSVEIKDLNDTDYQVEFNGTFENNTISVYKNGKEICKNKNRSFYFNIDFKKGFLINH